MDALATNRRRSRRAARELRRTPARSRPSLARVLALPAIARGYPGYADPCAAGRTPAFVIGSLLVHGAGIAVLFVMASLVPAIETRILHLTMLPETPPPAPVAVPEPPPIARRNPAPPALAVPAPPPAPRPELAPRPLPPPPSRVAPKPAPRLPLPQIDGVAAPERGQPDAIHRASPPVVASRAPRSARGADVAPAPAIAPPAAPASAGEVATRAQPGLARRRPPPPRAESSPPPIAPVPAAAPPPPRVSAPRARLAPPRPAPLEPARASDPRPEIRGVALASLAPCITDARELELKQRVVAVAANRALCESPAGRFHLVETKNVNAFLMGIEQAAGRRSGDRCEELALALDCLTNSPARSRR